MRRADTKVFGKAKNFIHMDDSIVISYYVLSGHNMGRFSSDRLSEIRGKVRPYHNSQFHK